MFMGFYKVVYSRCNEKFFIDLLNSQRNTIKLLYFETKKKTHHIGYFGIR